MPKKTSPQITTSHAYVTVYEAGVQVEQTNLTNQPDFAEQMASDINNHPTSRRYAVVRYLTH